MKYFSLFLSIVFLFLLASCDTEKYIYKKEIKVNDLSWEYADSLQYQFDIIDTSKLYSILLDIHHGAEYDYQNIYLNISTIFPSGKYLKQQLSSDLADKKGRWYGKCNSTSCTAPINLQETAKFNEVGKHHITIAQFTRDSSLKEVKDITLKLKEFIPPNQK